MKKFYLLIALIPFTSFCKSQQTGGVGNILSAGEFVASFPKTAYPESGILPFKNILAIDYRYDSSKIGYVWTGKRNSIYSKIKLSSDWSGLLNNYFKKNLDASSSFTLFIAIKSFWIQKGVPDVTNQKIVQKYSLENSNFSGHCKTDLDVFIKSGDSLRHLFQIRETFTNAGKFTSKKLNQWMFLAFDSVAKRISSINLPVELSTKRKISPDEISAFYEKRFDLPVLLDSAIKKGVFMTFEDFKKNKPLEVRFRLVRDNWTDELYISDEKRENVVPEFWGVYNGTHLFIQSGYNVYPAVRRQNSFEIFGAKHITNNHDLGSNPLYNSQRIPKLSRNKLSLEEEILQMDMDEGLFY